eukprot:749798-Hanusia_phi.AAC.13
MIPIIEWRPESDPGGQSGRGGSGVSLITECGLAALFAGAARYRGFFRLACGPCHGRTPLCYRVFSGGLSSLP